MTDTTIYCLVRTSTPCARPLLSRSVEMLQSPLWGESHHSSMRNGVFLLHQHANAICRHPSRQSRLSGPSGPEKCRGQGAATQTVRMYGKEAATQPSAFSQTRVSGPLFSSSKLSSTLRFKGKTDRIVQPHPRRTGHFHSPSQRPRHQVIQNMRPQPTPARPTLGREKRIE